MAKFTYGLFDKLEFYASYFWYKLILPVEMKSPRFSMWAYELAYTAHKFRNYEYCRPWKSETDIITTRFGSFKIRVNTADAANVSPAFERRDLNRLFALIDGLEKSGKRVLFLDVGGDIGTYSIAVANRVGSRSADIVCFEPIPASCELIRDNIERNQLADKVELIEVALMDEAQDNLKICLNALAPGSSSVKGEGEEVLVKADRLDNLLADRVGNYDALVLKVDVEGVEERVLRGASGLLEQGIETHLMVEDFIDRTVITYLEDHGWSFEGKLTDYNSWWKKS
jgi:FkbM family methyltransferase